MRTNPGTDNNEERTGDRDDAWSCIMRRPSSEKRGCQGLRSCDFDTTIICHTCKLPIFMVEVTRSKGYKAGDYVTAVANKIGIQAYLIRHIIDTRDIRNPQVWIYATCLTRIDSKEVELTEDQWVQFCEQEQIKHNKQFHS